MIAGDFAILFPIMVKMNPTDIPNKMYLIFFILEFNL